jgi:CheY-like chemotaxis protein
LRTVEGGYGGLAVLVLDDNDENRALSARIFANEDVRVVQAATRAEAERELIAHPGVDAVSLDICLHGNGRDKEGATLAMQIRELRPDLPIVGYSAYFEEHDLSPEERGAFTAYYHRGGDIEEISEYVDRCLDEGLEYRRRRRELFDQQLAKLVEAGQIEEREYSVLRSFSPAPSDELSIEHALTAAGYQVEVVLPSPPKGSNVIPRRPFVVWLRKIDETEEYEAEIFGQPSLYGVGGGPAVAIQNLLEVFWLLFEGLQGADLEELDGPALSLAHFFEHVLSR